MISSGFNSQIYGSCTTKGMVKSCSRIRYDPINAPTCTNYSARRCTPLPNCARRAYAQDEKRVMLPP